MNNKKEITDILIDYIKKKLHPKKRKQVAKLIKDDRDISDLFRLLNNLVREGRETEASALIGAAEKMSVKLFDDYRKLLVDVKPGRALAVYDSGVMPLPDDVRPATVDSRRMRFKSDKMEIEVSIYPVSIDLFDLVGQISGLSDIENCRVAMKSAKKKYIVDTDRFFLFQFDRIPTSEYSVSIESGKTIIAHFDLSL